ncbi:unnamed protein product, partial [Soboliphyme baturini]|uniref:Peptidase S1 domain-containing protein n=1 Tax=Soboliphyme baturini TaxID=241478 RepID=A0A183JB71_9BILA
GSSGSPVVGKIGIRSVIYGFFTSIIAEKYIILSDMVGYRNFVQTAARRLPSLPNGAIRKLRRDGTRFELVT